MFFFGKSHKGPFELIKTLTEALQVIEKSDARKLEKAQEDVSKNLVQMKNMLYGNSEEAQTDIAVAELAQELYKSHLLLTLINNLTRIELEEKKDVALIFNNILR